MNTATGKSLVLPLYRGPFQNNGATPWYCELGIGTPNQKLKICFDTGSNFNWVTSSLCSKEGCKHYADARFNIDCSTSFTMLNPKKQLVSFGPWGKMQVKTGRDKLSLPYKAKQNELFADLFLAVEYSGSQFEELDWDGGIGLASYQSDGLASVSNVSPFRMHYSKSNDESEFHFFLQLVQQGIVSASRPYLSFQTELMSGGESVGSIGFGELDTSYVSSREYIFMPWSCYQEEASYLWSSSGATVSVDGETAGSNMFFTLDSGSSQFKGDDKVLTTLFTATQGKNPVVSISLFGDDKSLKQPYGEFEITSDIYKCKIEAGEKKGQVVSQFQGLSDAENMLLVGSVLMDHLYTVYEYDVVSDDDIQPKGVWVFNKPGGPDIIKTKQSTPASLFNNVDGKYHE
ncbi:pepsin-like aspartic protease [Vibrio genomosp. F10]|uniref:pepsin-like aspartic protease n=1 Tax=Vibrio genomosp. F10 TaxID=723171 RepID=UPI00030866CA|nr:pepsin-like aspartic protease [Vibrio genomosp. F10]